MLIVATFIKAFWKQLLALALVLTAAISLGFSIYSWGYKTCHKEWDDANVERNRIQLAQTAEIKALATEVANSKADLLSNSDIQLTQILLSVKNKPMYRVDVNGKCTPSSEFEKAYNDIIKEGK